MDTELSFLNKIKEKEENTRHLETEFSNILFLTKDKIQIFNKTYSIASSAYLSINNQIKVKGAGFSELSDILITKIYNEVLQKDRLKNKKAKIFFIDDSIKSIMVGGTDKRAFKYTKATTIISKAKEQLDRNNCKYEFLMGNDDDYFTIARYKITNMFNLKYNVAIEISTSISGYSSIKVTPILYNESSEIILDESGLTIEHKGDTLSKIQERMRKVLEDINKYLTNMDNINKSQLTKTKIDSICRNSGLGLNARKYILRHFKEGSVEEFVSFMQELDFSGTHGERKEIILGRIFALLKE